MQLERIEPRSVTAATSVRRKIAHLDKSSGYRQAVELDQLSRSQ